LDQAVDFWIGVRSALDREERYVLVNIANEPFGNNRAVNSRWAVSMSKAIARLRAAGFAHTLVVDAPNWGQDRQFIMHDNAAAVFAGDPAANTVFSIHMYGVFSGSESINTYLRSFIDARLPIVIGEFGNLHSDGDPDEDAIMATAERLGVGYLGWSWSGNSGGVEYLDLVNNFSVRSLTTWGKRLFNGPDGIARTAEEASVYHARVP
jgi:mannan endo-1,4-beta-mannosidase